MIRQWSKRGSGSRHGLPRKVSAAAALALVTFAGPSEPLLRPAIAEQSALALYVSPDGSDRGDGSSARPLRTISEALSRARPGTTVLVSKGRYFGQVVTRRGGVEGAEITIRGLGGSVVIDGSRLDRSGARNQNQGLVELRHPFVRLENVTVANAPNTGILLDADHLTIEGCNIMEARLHGISTETSRQPNYRGRPGRMIRQIVLRNNVVERAATSGHGQSVSLIADGFLIAGNTVRNSPKEGIDIWLGARRGEVAGNRVHGNKAAGIYVDGAADVRIHGNVVYANGSGIGVSSEDVNYTTTDILVYNNVIHDNTASGIFIWDQGKGPKGSQRVTIAHNTLIGNGSSIYLSGEDNTGAIFNNLGYSGGPPINNRARRSPLLIRNNVWLREPAGFASITAKNFRLNDRSPAIDKGAALAPVGGPGGISTDFDGRPRRSGPQPDAGAFEFSVQ